MEQLGLLGPRQLRGRNLLQCVPVDGETLWTTVSRRYFEARIPCPFLEDERCSVYADRPLVCREHAVTTPPALCDTLGSEARGLARPLDVTQALVEIAETVTDVAPARAIPLPLSLEWAAVNGGRLQRASSGDTDLLGALVERLDLEEEPLST
jgi:hypothetical protein